MADIYLLIEGKQEGPYTEEQVRHNLAEGRISYDLLAWREGLTGWVAVSGVLSEATATEVEYPVSDAKELPDEIQEQISRLQDTDVKVRFNAVKALSKSGDVRAVDPLVVCLKDQNWQVRFHAAEALGKFGDARAVDPLVSCSKDESKEVRDSVTKALGLLGVSIAIDLQAPSVDRSLLADFPRYWLAAYALAATAPTAGMLLGAGAMLIGGVGTPDGDFFFGIGAVIGFLVGLVPGFIAMVWISPKEPAAIQSVRQGAIGAGSFFFLIVQLFSGIAIMDWMHLTTILPKFFQAMPGHILGVALTGGILSSFCATLFMVYQERKK